MRTRPRPNRPRAARALVSALAAAALLAGAAAAQKSDAEIQDDIEFAKGLAKDWGFVDLATDVIKRIENAGVPTRQKERLAVTKCEIYEVAAINERDRLRRNQLFEQALQAYSEFIEANRLSTALSEAQMGYVRLSAMYARSIEIALEDAVGEQVEQLTQRRIDVLTKAVAMTGTLISELKAIPEKTEAQKADLADLMLNRGSMLLDVGRAQENGVANFEYAKQTLEDVVFEFGEATPPALRAYDLIGRVYAAQQQWSLARDFFEAVVEQAIPTDPKAWSELVKEQELTQGDKEKRWLFVELSTEGLVNAYSAMGDSANAAKYALHLYNAQKREGFAYSLQLGYPSLLAAARTLLECGGWVAGDLAGGDVKWYPTEDEAKAAVSNRRNRLSCTDFALRIADQVNKENKGNVLQIRAQKLIAEVIDQPGVEVDPGVLYEAAEGAYNDGNHAAAIAGFKRVLRALEGKDEATRLQYGPRIFFRMGRTYQRMGRPLEAALAFQEGCTTWVGDPEYDDDNAQSFYTSMQEVVRMCPGDQAIQALLSESENKAAELSKQDADQINFNLGRKAYRNDDFDEALKRFGEVKPAGLDYEKALVFIAVCKLRKGETSEAERLLDQYIEEYVKDATHPVGTSPAKAAKRQDAMAMAEFYRSLIGFKRAERATSSGNDDPALWQRVVDLSTGYEDRYPEQTDYAPVTMRNLMNAQLALGKTAEARKVYDKLFEKFPEDKFTQAAATDLYLSLKKLQEEAAKAGEVDRARQLLLEMAQLLEYGNKADPNPSAGNLRQEAIHWMDLHEWAKAEASLTRFLSRFGNDPAQADTIAKFVRPDLAHALLEQNKVAQAHEILIELTRVQDPKPTKRTVVDYARSVIGWVDGDARNIEIVPGAGTAKEEFDTATQNLDIIAKTLGSQWTCEWYAYKFEVAYGYYVWATADWSPDKVSSKKDTAKGILNALIVELGPDFRGKGTQGVDASCEGSDPDLVAEYGKDVLRSRMVWLWTKVR